MAAGLGTRMRSATPKHLHPLLGRRMVDWVIAAARDTGAEPIVVVASPQTRDGFDGVEVAVQEQPLGTGDAVARGTREARPANGDVLVLSGDTPLLTADALRELLDDASARARGRDRALVRAARSAAVRTHRPRRGRPARAHRRGVRRDARRARAPRGQLVDLRLRGGQALARARAAAAEERAGRALPHRRGRLPRAGRRAGRGPRRRRSARGRGGQHARRARRRRGRVARPHQRARTCSPA